ncbi:MAG: Trk system potassium transporter TrkA [bacterium]
MRIVIVGGGVVGHSLAEHLVQDNHHLSLVELDAELCRSISEKLDLQILNGSGSSPSVLLDAGLDDADMVLAVTPNDEVNMVVCGIAAQYNVGRRIARLRNREFAKENAVIDLERMGITHVIHPEEVLVDHILQFVETPHAVESANFEDGRILLRGYRVRNDMELAGKTPSEIRGQIAPAVVLFAAVVRHGEGMIPDGDMRFQAGDIVYTIFPHESLERFLGLVAIEHKPSRKIILTGSSYSTIQLARALDTTDHKVVLVDPSAEHAEKAAAQLSRVEVIHGDATQHDLLRDINVESASFFIAASDAADYNMLSALLAKAEGAHEVITTTTEWQHDRLFQSIGIDHVLNPRLTTAREILEIIARGHIGAVVKLAEVDIEAVRFDVGAGAAITGESLRNMGRKLKGALVGIIIRNKVMILPTGDTVIEEGDHVIVVVHQKRHAAISKLFQGR